MTAVHRPLTCWIRDAQPAVPAEQVVGGPAGPRPGSPGPAALRWRAYGPVNDGDERADARDLPRFATGWRRTALPLADGGHALALVLPGTGRAVFELTDDGRPLPADPATARAVAAVEDRWPPTRLDAAERAALAVADPNLRFSLLDRLAREGEPDPDCFHVLPWERVERLAREVTAALQRPPGTPDAPPGTPPVRLRHHFSPTGSRFTAALEQLAAGLHAGDPRTARVGAAGLCVRLAVVPADRLPANTRRRLAGLLDAVADDDVFLRASAAVAAAHVAVPGSRPVPPVRRSAGVRALLAPAAAPDQQRYVEDEVVREPFTIRLSVDSGYRAVVEVTAPLTSGAADRLAAAYGELLLPVRVSGTGSDPDLYVLLDAEDDELSGELDLPAVRGELVTADQSGPPVGVAELPYLSVPALRATVRALTSHSDRRRWLGLAAGLPQGHPVRTAIEEEARA